MSTLPCPSLLSFTVMRKDLLSSCVHLVIINPPSYQDNNHRGSNKISINDYLCRTYVYIYRYTVYTLCNIHSCKLCPSVYVCILSFSRCFLYTDAPASVVDNFPHLISFCGHRINCDKYRNGDYSRRHINMELRSFTSINHAR